MKRRGGWTDGKSVFRAGGPSYGRRCASHAGRKLVLHQPAQIHGSAVDDERPVANGVKGAPLPSGNVDPSPDALQEDDARSLDVIGHAAFQTGEAFGDKRRVHVRGGQRRQPELPELVDVRARAVADADCRFRHVDGRHRQSVG